MDPSLTFALVVAGFSGVSAFIGYWRGFDGAERSSRRRIAHLQATLREQQQFTLELADRLYRLKASSALTAQDRATFDQIVANYREDYA